MTPETIKPRIDENGEPWCSSSCPLYMAIPCPDDCALCTTDGICVPALREQRDEARADRDRLRTKILAVLDCYHTAPYGLAADIRAVLAEKE